jgi:hypothetical protein
MKESMPRCATVVPREDRANKLDGVPVGSTEKGSKGARGSRLDSLGVVLSGDGPDVSSSGGRGDKSVGRRTGQSRVGCLKKRREYMNGRVSFGLDKRAREGKRSGNVWIWFGSPDIGVGLVRGDEMGDPAETYASSWTASPFGEAFLLRNSMTGLPSTSESERSMVVTWTRFLIWFRT